MPPRKRVTLIGEKYGLKIPMILRADWKARRGSRKWIIWNPVPYVKLSYTGSHECHDLRACAEILQSLQKYSKDEQRKGDIPWNFMVSSEGHVYQGRGWYAEPFIPKELKWLTGNMIDIAFVGNYEHEDPPWLMINTAMQLIEYGVLTGLLAPNFKIIPYRDKRIPQVESVE